ncbi:MAG: rRNA maturation RNase YbeY [Rubrivivax sp.]|nr:rRNA maturation RNase YbeY [Rubrivivax sp.]
MTPRGGPMPELQLSLQMPDARHRGQLPRHRVARWIRAALQAPADITVRIVNEDEGRALNRDYRGKDYATNVLTFDYARAPRVQADLVLCAPVVEREAAAAGIELQAHYAHLLVHGTLHAQGYDHETSDADAARMEALESRLLLGLGFADPYLLS